MSTGSGERWTSTVHGPSRRSRRRGSVALRYVIVIMIAQQAARLLPHVMPMQAELTFLIFVGAAIASALAFCRLVEQPLLRIFRKLPAIFAPRLETPR